MMWIEADERIRSRITANIVNSARTRLLVYVLVLFLSFISIYFLLLNRDSYFATLMLCLLLCFEAVCLIAVFYIYFSTVRENTKILRDAAYMTVGVVVTRLGDDGRIIVKLPGDKNKYAIDCDKDFYKVAETDSRVLVVAVSKKNEDLMIGYDPATYDKDGIF